MKKPDPEIERLADEWLDVLCSLYPLGYRPELIWKNLRVSAGLAYFTDRRIALSTRLMSSPERLQCTLIHEYAHLLAFARHGRAGRGHGAAWKKAMQDLGATPEIYHSYEVERNRSATRLLYQCECGVQFFRRRKIARIERFRHAGCGGRLRFLGEETSNTN